MHPALQLPALLQLQLLVLLLAWLPLAQHALLPLQRPAVVLLLPAAELAGGCQKGSADTQGSRHWPTGSVCGIQIDRHTQQQRHTLTGCDLKPINDATSHDQLQAMISHTNCMGHKFSGASLLPSCI